jgi:membrane-associated phospholipid phosphatase
MNPRASTERTGFVHSDLPPDPPIETPQPGQARFGPAVEAFDEAADRWLERFRGDPVLDRVMTIATHAGEFSAIWHVSSVVRGLARGRPDQIVALAIGIGAESLLVNQGLKRIFRRPRPTTSGDQRFEIRTPLTSSFPSGHASAATFAAVCLVGWDGRRWAPLWLPMAATVVVSRPYVRIHHASDIVGGVVAGAAMGLVARRIFRRLQLG